MVEILRFKIEDVIKLRTWFRRQYPNVSFVSIARLARSGQIRVNSKRVGHLYILQPGDELRFPLFPQAENVKRNKCHKPSRELISLIKNSILYMDEHIVAFNKPYGLATQGGSKITQSFDNVVKFLFLDGQDNEDENGQNPAPLKLVHRLDKETTGVFIMARSADVAADLGRIFQGRDIQKKYLAVLAGVPKAKSDTINVPLVKKESKNGKEYIFPDENGIGAKNIVNDEFVEEVDGLEDGIEAFDSYCKEKKNQQVHKKYSKEHKVKNAITQYRVLDYADRTVSLVEMIPLTGRTHQLRVHSMHINCPILGDKKYGYKAKIQDESLHLHSYQISFRFKGKDISITAPIPSYFKETLEKFGMRYNK